MPRLGIIRMPVRYDRIVALVFALGLLLAGAIGANAQGGAKDLESALQGFTTDDFSDTIDAVNAVATSGSPLAADVIQALQDGRLMFSAAAKKVFIQPPDGKLLDAATGKPAAGDRPADVQAVNLSNRVRRAVDAALGSLTLLAADPAKRYEAAQAVFTSRDAAVLPVLDAALAKETDT